MNCAVYFMPKNQPSRLEILVEIRAKVKEAKEKHPKKFLNREALIGEVMRVYNISVEDANQYCDDAGVYKGVNDG